ncbi:hypothetical protein [Caedibacter taeniospiralis]|uniref:hypothetical protein n=1 Tax=Caedibacter taeniospiralis TaxID=28907 RepID=UPI000C26E66C|nr:hypothetical protein [Caedibacter taeniospiralis]
MKKALIPLLTVGVLFSAINFAAESGKAEVIVEAKSILGDLSMTQKIVISAADVTAGKDKIFELAEFCTYTNNKDGKVTIDISTNEKKFAVIGTNSEGELPYTLTINKTAVNYGKNLLYVDSNDLPSGCKTKEIVTMTFKGSDIRNAKAGTYNASLNLSVA